MARLREIITVLAMAACGSVLCYRPAKGAEPIVHLEERFLEAIGAAGDHGCGAFLSNSARSMANPATPN